MPKGVPFQWRSFSVIGYHKFVYLRYTLVGSILYDQLFNQVEIDIKQCINHHRETLDWWQKHLSVEPVSGKRNEGESVTYMNSARNSGTALLSFSRDGFSETVARLTALNCIGTPTALFVCLEGFFIAHLIHLLSLRGNAAGIGMLGSAVAWDWNFLAGCSKRPRYS